MRMICTRYRVQTMLCYNVFVPALRPSSQVAPSLLDLGLAQAATEAHGALVATEVCTAKYMLRIRTTFTADTLAQRATKRLTIIHESKDSIGSEADRVASLATKRKSLPTGTLSSFCEPMPMESLMEESSTPVDPKRVFSALMREIEISKAMEPASDLFERTPGAESDVFESSRTKVLHADNRDLQTLANRDIRSSTSHEERQPPARALSAAAQNTQGKANSIRTLGRVIRSTIRNVSPAEPRSSPCPEQPLSVRGAVRIPEDDVEISSAATTPDTEEDCINIGARLVKTVYEVEVRALTCLG
jgi:hypothetical protein